MNDNTQPQVGISNEELAEQVYDLLMREIEPDLLSYNLPKIDEFYTSETEAEKEKRMERYQQAYASFEIAFNKFMSMVHTSAQKSKQVSLKQAEQADRANEVDDIASAAANIDSL